MSRLDLFCSVDTFWQEFAPLWERELVAAGRRRRKRATRLSPSAIMTILILFQQSGYRTFTGFSTQHVHVQLRAEFPRRVRSTRFVDLMPRVLLPLAVYVQTQFGTCTGISFVDSTSLVVCHNARIRQHRVFRADARRGKTSVGWCYGFTLHLVASDRGELLAVCLSWPDPRQCGRPSPRPTPGAAPLRHTLWRPWRASPRRLPNSSWSSRASTSLPTYARTCASGCSPTPTSCCCTSMRSLSASMISSRTSARPEHTRPHSSYHFLVHLLCALIAYCHQPKKPSLQLDLHREALPAA